MSSPVRAAAARIEQAAIDYAEARATVAVAPPHSRPGADARVLLPGYAAAVRQAIDRLVGRAEAAESHPASPVHGAETNAP